MDGEVFTVNNYFPFGLCRISQGNLGIDRQFTGQILDSTGLYYYNARYYDPTIGRFISADTVVQCYSNPQTFNRYSYCTNNPLNRTDPSGHFNVADDGESGYVLAHPTRTGFIVRLFDIFTHPKDWVIEQGINTITGPAGPKVDIVPSVVDKNDIPESQQAAYNLGQTMADVTVQTGITVGIGCAVGPSETSIGANIERDLVKGTGGKIAGFANDAGLETPHGLDRMLFRNGVGVSNSAVINAVNYPLVPPIDQGGGYFLYMGKNAQVVLQNGNLVTTWAENSSGMRYISWWEK